jgi:rhomboid protease GluP
MDLSQLLSLMVLISSLTLFVRARRAGLGQRNTARIALALSLASGAAMAFASTWGSYVVLAAWALTMLVPGLLIRRLQQAGQAQDFAQVARLLGILQRFRPSAHDVNVRSTYRALALAQAGDREQALSLLRGLRELPGAPGMRARAEILRLTQRWEELLALGFEADFELYARTDPTLTLLWLRSLGECGKRALLVSEWQQMSPRLSLSGNQGMLDHARIALFAFTGQTAALDALLKERLPLLPADNAALWRATAAYANGDVETGRRLIQAQLDTKRHETRRALQRRLTEPVATEPAPGEAELLRAEVQRLQHDIEYAETPAGAAQRAPFTRGLIVALLVAFAYQMKKGGTTDFEILLQLGGFRPIEVLERGEWWRVLSYQFLHGGVLHLSMNLLGLNLLGPEVERRIGSLRTALVYFASGAAGGLLSVALFAYGLKEPQLLVGASGGIMGLVGATMAAFFRGHVLDRSAAAARRLRQAAFLVVLQTVVDYLTPQLSMLAHLTGVVVGFLVALLLGRPKRAS